MTLSYRTIRPWSFLSNFQKHSVPEIGGSCSEQQQGYQSCMTANVQISELPTPTVYTRSWQERPRGRAGESSRYCTAWHRNNKQAGKR